MDAAKKALCEIENRVLELSDEKEQKILEIEEKKRSILDETIRIYGKILRPAHIELLKLLSDLNLENKESQLLRRSFLASYYGICVSAVLEHPKLEHIKSFFPSLKLPLALSNEDISEFESLHCGSVPLKNHFENVFNAYLPDKRSKPEENLRSLIWTPILMNYLNSLKSTFGRPELNLSLEFNLKTIPNFSWLRFVDFAFAPNNGGLPILIIEIAADEVPSGCIHKDFRKMSVAMAHILMELIQRAKSECSDEDLSRFRVYGLLISGRHFEFCVGSVVKSSNGKINFMFHTNNEHWKYALFGDQVRPFSQTESDFICKGHTSIYSEFMEMTSSSADFDPGMFIEIEEMEIDDVQEADICAKDEALSYPSVSWEALAVLWKFLKDMMIYYENLPTCLRNCILEKLENINIDAANYSFPPQQTNPYLAKSESSHKIKSSQHLPSEYFIDMIITNEFQKILYNELWSRPFQNLPNVLVFNEVNNKALIRRSSSSVSVFSAKFNASYDKISPSLCPVYGLIVGKLLLDIIMAVHFLHSRDLICGSIEPKFFEYNGVYWRLADLPRLCSVEDASIIDLNYMSDFRTIYHVPTEENFHILSQRDDIYGIAKVIKLCFMGLLSYVIDKKCEIPIFDEFLAETIDKMLNYKTFPDLDTVAIITAAAPIFDRLINSIDTGNRIPDDVIATNLLIKKTYHEILEESSGSSVQTHPISETGIKTKNE